MDYEKMTQRVRDFQRGISEIASDITRAQNEPVTLKEFDVLKLCRDTRTLTGPTHGTPMHPESMQSQIISASEIIRASQEAKERLTMVRELYG